VSTVQAGIAQPKPLTVPNSDFCELAGTLNAEELAVVKQVRVFMEHKVAPIINKYWADDAFPFELLPALKEPNIDGLGLQGYGRGGGSQKLFWLRRHGDGTRRLLVLHLLRRPQQPGDGLHLPQRIGGAETEVAAADGAPRKDRLFRPDRAAGGFGNRRRHDDDSQA
jgi:hypothetical protein